MMGSDKYWEEKQAKFPALADEDPQQQQAGEEKEEVAFRGGK